MTSQRQLYVQTVQGHDGTAQQQRHPQRLEASAGTNQPASPTVPEGQRQHLSPTHGLPFDAETMQLQLEAFVRDGLCDSARLLGEFLVAIANNPPMQGKREVFPRSFHARSFELFADLLMLQREYQRAIQYYKRCWKTILGSSPTAIAPEAVHVKVKIARCWIELDGAHQAIEVLNSIPQPSRSLSVNLLLGRLYLEEGLKQKAEESYRSALRQNPYALEATMALADLAAARESAISQSTATSDPQQDIERFYAKLSTMRPSTTKTISRVDANWLQILVNAHIHARRGRYGAAMEAFDALESLFPNNLHVLLNKGFLEMEQDCYHQAHVNFHRARQVDEHNLTMMDAYADCLRKNGARVQLNSLVHDLFETSDNHPESWLAAAYYSELKGEHETALQFSERAIFSDRHYAPAHLFRGKLLLQMHRPEHAVVSFTTSCKLQKTHDAYGGIVTSFCDMCLKGVNKYKEALTTAKSVVKLYPHKAESYTLLGNVFALRPENKDQARKAFQRALAMEPRKLSAVFGLVDLLARDGNLSQAIDRLLVLCDQMAREEVFTKLADMYTLTKQFAEAMTFYHRALSLNSASEAATRGLERLEKIMHGEDPDELNTTMEQLEHDEQDDSMEVGEYAS